MEPAVASFTSARSRTRRRPRREAAPAPDCRLDTRRMEQAQRRATRRRRARRMSSLVRRVAPVMRACPRLHRARRSRATRAVRARTLPPLPRPRRLPPRVPRLRAEATLARLARRRMCTPCRHTPTRTIRWRTRTCLRRTTIPSTRTTILTCRRRRTCILTGPARTARKCSHTAVTLARFCLLTAHICIPTIRAMRFLARAPWATSMRMRARIRHMRSTRSMPLRTSRRCTRPPAACRQKRRAARDTSLLLRMRALLLPPAGRSSVPAPLPPRSLAALAAQACSLLLPPLRLPPCSIWPPMTTPCSPLRS